MKKLAMFFMLTAVFLMLLAGACPAAVTPEPARPRLMVDSAGNLVSSSNPLPVTTVGGSGTLGSVSISLPLTASQTVKTVSSTGSTVTAIAAREKIALWNLSTETVYLAVGTAASSNSVPVYQGGYISLDIPTAMAVNVWCATGPASLAVLQLGR